MLQMENNDGLKCKKNTAIIYNLEEEIMDLRKKENYTESLKRGRNMMTFSTNYIKPL